MNPLPAPHRFADGYAYDLEQRWGGAKPAHAELSRIFAEREADYRNLLALLLEYAPELREFPLHTASGESSPSWINGFFPGLDTFTLYGLVAKNAPRLYLEIGSGNSTKIVHRARTHRNLATRIVSIDPMPRAEVDEICDEVVRERLEDVDLKRFENLSPGDILFFDGSHRALQNSDVTVFFMDVLPLVPKGVLIHIHDIALPYDYPEEWRDRLYNEQYVLGPILLFSPEKWKIVLPNVYVSYSGLADEVLADFWKDEKLKDVQRHGCSFWMERR